ncbi:non-hydrolyzing UDP-N-acetylglucosamine 2-epimerase [Candidatus Chrysopegis kryptomonas]|uniref:UDP-N-acetylglucosamine 2-epimerase (Non-hydrolysing) n=1 Tax=Candidatus Chryseopegocella kryptomonas TaxID=1633643 RepID=A0A0P1MX87_9BACT|nr:UDP-N-acetylglucosamine 2-epimerase (non-hydrolyzing) [Candidatus Chrysopegis kryptomonas]CUT00798.1 UDP-N-acetylglucosamine 2-epimerase (non-hydrolysing) [Candidatus Chrysopegis kryptomonas]
MKKIISVVGARPNFMKIAPIHRAFKKFREEHPDSEIIHKICHTGQHYDNNMSDIFIKELELPKPDFYLGVGSGSHAVQTAKIMIEFEKVLLNEKPDLVIVVGDVNSTIACSLTAVKCGIKVAHVEAGLRSFDRSMPEEINRILTDAISDYLFVSEKSGIANLKREGIPDERIFFVGNVMIDSLVYYLPKIDKSNVLKNFYLKPFEYGVVTLHRPSNVDYKDKLSNIVDFLREISVFKRLVFPVHPRTYNNLEKFGLLTLLNHNIVLTQPMGYIDFIALVKNSSFVLTDSGGIQEETTYLGIPCITLRNSTERPITVEIGTNYLAGEDINTAYGYIWEIINGNAKVGKIPELWDGKASERIVEIIVRAIQNW